MAGAWTKLGRLYEPRAVHPLLATHAANPLAVHREGPHYRVFYSGRDAQNRSSVGHVDVDMDRREVVQVGTEPAFSFGAADSFYSHGVSIGNCYEAGGQRYMPFMGWQLREGRHWRGDIGRLRVSPDLQLTLDDDQPLLGASSVDPISLSYPWVQREGDGYRMWYGSTVAWDTGAGEMLHVINHATSADGHRWQRHGLAVPFALGQAQAFSRPCVLGDAARGYDMWFSYRGGSGTPYRIGRASSVDGLAWRLRLDAAGIDVSAEGWDSEMIEYPFVFPYAGRDYMLYNGNGYGRTGFGLAVLEPGQGKPT
jgi:hypothetical protein